jgi:8-oxo-dGTP diphosphatase
VTDEKLHYVVVTGVVVKDEKYLIAKRSKKEAAFPGLWTVPGGKLRKGDYLNSPKDTSDHWYHVLEKLLKREIKEEVGLRVKNIRYLLSLAYTRSDGLPSVILSFYCNYDSGKVKLSEELTDYTWVSVNELDQYNFVPGLREEIELTDKAIREGKRLAWEGKYNHASNQSLRDGKDKK